MQNIDLSGVRFIANGEPHNETIYNRPLLDFGDAIDSHLEYVLEQLNSASIVHSPGSLLPNEAGTIYSYNAAIANTANTAVIRGASGNFSAGTITASLSGNATTATTLQTARNINGTSFNGSSAITTALWGTARNITIGNTTKSVNGSINVSWSQAEIGYTASDVLTKLKTVDGVDSGLDADLLDGMQPATANTANTIVQRDASGNFSAGTITASLSGNATTVTNGVYTSRSISAGNGLTGGGDLSENRVITLGAPSTLSGGTTNDVTASSHTHAISSTASRADTSTATLLQAKGMNDHRLSGDHDGRYIRQGTRGGITAPSSTTEPVFRVAASTNDGENATVISAEMDSSNTTNRYLYDGVNNTGDRVFRVATNGDITTDGTITGNGSGLTTLDASNLSSGTVPSERLTGSYAISVTGNAGTVTNGVYTSRSVTAGNGLTGGGTLAANRVITLGAPSTLSGGTTNTVTASSHTHAISSTASRTDTSTDTLLEAKGMNDHRLSGDHDGRYLGISATAANTDKLGGNVVALTANSGDVVGGDNCMILCPAATVQNVLGTLWIQRTTMHYGLTKIDILYGTGTTVSSRNAHLQVTQSEYRMGVFTVGIIDISGTDYIVLRRTGEDFFHSDAWFVGKSSYQGDNFLNWVVTPAQFNEITLTGKTTSPGFEGNGSGLTNLIAPMKVALNAVGSAPIYACRAWVNFNAETGNTSGTPSTVRGSGNIASVNYLGTGTFEINFINNMPDTNYAVVVTIGPRLGRFVVLNRTSLGNSSRTAPLVNKFRIHMGRDAETFHRPDDVHLAVFR